LICCARFSAAFSGGPIEAWGSGVKFDRMIGLFSAAFSGGPIEAGSDHSRKRFLFIFSAAFSGGPIEAAELGSSRYLAS